MNMENLVENIQQKRTSRSKISKSKGVIRFRMLKYIAFDNIIITIIFKYSLTIYCRDCYVFITKIDFLFPPGTQN